MKNKIIIALLFFAAGLQAQILPNQSPEKTPEGTDAIYTQENGQLNKILFDSAFHYFVPRINVNILGYNLDTLNATNPDSLRGQFVRDVSNSWHYVDSSGLAFKFAASSGGGATQLNQLTDVTLTSLATGEVLRYNGSLWVNDSIKSLHNIDSLSFNTSASTVTETGSLGWNNEDQTLDLKINGVTLQIGQEMYKLVKNASGATIQNGQVVRYSGAVGASSRIEANLMVADGTYPAYHTIGVATEDILNGEMGFITNFGAVRGINTSGYTAGDILYVDPTTPGALTNVEPTAPNQDIPVAIALDSKNNGSIFVRPVLFPALNDVQDVAISNVATGQVLRYDGTKWTNSTERDTSNTNEIQYLTFRGDTLELTDDPTNVILPYLDQSEISALVGDTATVLRAYADQAEQDAKDYADANDTDTQLTPTQVATINRDSAFIERTELQDSLKAFHTLSDFLNTSKSYVEGSRILIEDTGAEYLVENSTISGYNSGNPDARACINLGGGLYANLQPVDGGYRYTHAYKTNSTSTFQAIFELAEATGYRAIVDGSGGMSSNLTVAGGTVLEVEKGALITISGSSLTIDGFLDAGPYQIFNDVGAGTFDFSNTSTPFVLPEWWGAGTVSNDEPRIELAAETAPKLLLAGAYIIQSTINITRSDLIIQLDGSITAVSNSSIFALSNCDNVKITGQGFLDGNNGSLTSGNGIVIQGENTQISISNITIRNTANQGIRINPQSDTVSIVVIDNVTIRNSKDIGISVSTTETTGVTEFLSMRNCNIDIDRKNTFFDHVENLIITNNILGYKGSGQHAIGVFGPAKNVIISSNIGISRDNGSNNLGVTLGSSGDMENIIVNGNIMRGNGNAGDGYEVASWGRNTRNFVMSSNISSNHVNGIVFGVSDNDTTNYKNISITGNVVDSARNGVRILHLATSNNPGSMEGVSISGNVIYGKDSSNIANLGLALEGVDSLERGFLGYSNLSNNIVSNFGEGLRTAHSLKNMGVGNLLYNNQKGINYLEMDSSFYAMNLSLDNVLDIDDPTTNNKSILFDPEVSSSTLQDADVLGAINPYGGTNTVQASLDSTKTYVDSKIVANSVTISAGTNSSTYTFPVAKSNTNYIVTTGSSVVSGSPSAAELTVSISKTVNDITFTVQGTLDVGEEVKVDFIVID